MSDAATKLAEEIKARHFCAQDRYPEFGSDRPRFCWECGETFGDDGDLVESWPCDAVRAADMLLELARAADALREHGHQGEAP